MFTRVTHLRRDERGMSFVFIGMGFMSFLAASTLAIDVGMLMTARTQAQTAADAGALAGAVALAYNSATNFSSSGPAVQGALSAARSDLVMGQQVSIQSGDVTFLPDPATGNTTRVQVTVYRSSVRGNPVPTMIGRIFGISSADISATAVAEAIPANASNCVKPFAIPDKWTEKQTAPWDTSDSFNAAILPPTFSPDVYKTVLDATYTGYKRSNVGLQINMLPATGQIQASQYYALDFSGSYQGNIENCAAAKVTIGDKIAAFPWQHLTNRHERRERQRDRDQHRVEEGRANRNLFAGQRFERQRIKRADQHLRLIPALVVVVFRAEPGRF